MHGDNRDSPPSPFPVDLSRIDFVSALEIRGYV